MPDDEIRARGLRLTPQRQLVLDAVRELGHATPEEIAQTVRQMHAGINLSTVYRNLETLETAVAPLITRPTKLRTCTWSVATAEKLMSPS